MRQRTKLQNRSLHLFYTLLADGLNAAGMDMKKVIKPEINIPWTMESVKEFLWRPIQKAMFQKESTVEITTLQLQAIYDVLMRELGEKFCIENIPFPSQEQTASYLKSFKK